jgi:predicted O-methyltransferase YrrM
MSTLPTPITEAVHRYILATSIRDTPALARLREETLKVGELARMQISPEQGQLMALLVETIGARRLLEIGTFTGYSALVCALALPPDGKLVACDTSEEWTSVARRHWQEAGVASKIDLRLAPALDTLKALLGEGRAGSFDMAFIDADKTNYDAYYEQCLKLVRVGGLIGIDNTLWLGRVADPSDQSPDTAAIRALNAKIARDERVSMSQITIGDGFTLARRRI